MATTEVRDAAASEQVSASEIMVTAASMEVHDGETAVVGIGLPQLACVLARRTHAPGMSMVLEIGVVNMAAALTILVGTPLVGLTFALPGDGRLGFVVVAAVWALATLCVPATAVARAPAGSNPGLSRIRDV